jgi:hypothetical protein
MTSSSYGQQKKSLFSRPDWNIIPRIINSRPSLGSAGLKTGATDYLKEQL